MLRALESKGPREPGVGCGGWHTVPEVEAGVFHSHPLMSRLHTRKALGTPAISSGQCSHFHLLIECQVFACTGCLWICS